MDLGNKFRELCTPAKIYFVLLIANLVFGIFANQGSNALILHLIFGLLWTMVLSYLCKKDMKPVSWVLVMVPIILSLLVGESLWSMQW